MRLQCIVTICAIIVTCHGRKIPWKDIQFDVEDTAQQRSVCKEDLMLVNAALKVVDNAIERRFSEIEESLHMRWREMVAASEKYFSKIAFIQKWIRGGLKEFGANCNDNKNLIMEDTSCKCYFENGGVENPPRHSEEDERINNYKPAKNNDDEVEIGRAQVRNCCQTAVKNKDTDGENESEEVKHKSQQQPCPKGPSSQKEDNDDGEDDEDDDEGEKDQPKTC